MAAPDPADEKPVPPDDGLAPVPVDGTKEVPADDGLAPVPADGAAKDTSVGGDTIADAPTAVGTPSGMQQFSAPQAPFTGAKARTESPQGIAESPIDFGGAVDAPQAPGPERDPNVP